MFDSGFFLYLGCVLFKLGALAFAFLVPALAGYIAYAHRRPAGHRARLHRRRRLPSSLGAGFIGGLVGGLLAGFVALWIARLKVPQLVRGLMPVVDHPAVRDAHRRRHDVDGPRQAARRVTDELQDCAQQHDRHARPCCSASCSA